MSGEKLKFSELTAWVRNVSYGWQAAGLEAGQVVCVVSPNCILAPPTFLAAIAASGIVSFANPLYTPGYYQIFCIDSHSLLFNNLIFADNHTSLFPHYIRISLIIYY